MAYKIIQIDGMNETYAAKINAAGIKYVEDYLLAVRTPQQRQLLATATGIDPDLILRWANHADLCRLHGIGPQYATFLEMAGVDTVKELAQRVPENLLKKLEEVNAETLFVKRVPALKEVVRYVNDAKGLEPMLEY